VIPRSLLLAAHPLGGALDAERVARAIARGLLAAGAPAPDECPIALSGEDPAELSELLQDLAFEERMRRARAVVLATPRLDEGTLLGSAAFEIATRARQGGVPAYAVTARNELSSFDARMLDLQLILEARTERGLAGAGKRLAGLV